MGKGEILVSDLSASEDQMTRMGGAQRKINSALEPQQVVQP